MDRFNNRITNTVIANNNAVKCSIHCREAVSVPNSDFTVGARIKAFITEQSFYGLIIEDYDFSTQQKYALLFVVHGWLAVFQKVGYSCTIWTNPALSTLEILLQVL